ncbi:hypothetical protein BU25DRAFT_492878 [Macroventuria anomochaeta]|uniref:Uncharacterized protein n=1 Tax=Macroventuria anomochaeta TaxID=301207 RepID=A0ACB6RWW8_9PLEO|nr:uncharacterized protein BU25DRAFT_492878 [Macroventuria anomochaeta]KAF2625628.1 hypothetical protein BU25DRAFT_492878 [Macroventuria anomochaeta]
MDGRGATSAIQLRNRDAFKTPNLSKPPAKAVTISAAAVFKKRKLDTAQLRSSSRSPQKSTVKKMNKKRPEEEVHALALAFKETSEEYRRHLYSTAVAKIRKDLDTLLNKLYESNLQVASSDPTNSGSQASPLKLTAPAKYQRIVQKLCNPLSGYRYNFQRIKTSGEIERVQTTLYDRFQSFEEHMRAEMQQIKELQRQWEGVVAEVFQLGIACLGENDIAALLSTADTDVNDFSPASKAESTPFVPEHDSSAKGKGKRKRVSFAGPDMISLFPGFLFQTSGHQKKPIPAIPDLPSGEVQQLEGKIAGLGKQHVADLQRLEKEHKAWWERKQNQLAHTFLQD